jgi:shikimate dehydrogenase
VTLPHKRDIIPFLDAVDEEAQLCGAVNTVVARGDKLLGYNTDMEGLLASLRDKGREYRNRNIVILGAGGACRGVLFKAAREKAAKITVLSRRLEKAEEVASEAEAAVACSVQAGSLSPETLANAAGDADILINATPLGMSGIGEDFPSLEFLGCLPRGALVCDLVYDPPLTSLLRQSQALGYAVRNGLGMLVHQGILADELFLGRKLNRSSLYEIVDTKLSE